MADRILKPDSGNDLVLQNDDASAKLEINEDGSMPLTGTISGSADVSGGTFTTSSAQKQAIVQAGPGSGTLDDSSGTFTTSSAQKQAIVQAGPGSGTLDVSSGTFTTSTAQKTAILAGGTYPDGMVTNFIHRQLAFDSNTSYSIQSSGGAVVKIAIRGSDTSAEVPSFTAKQGFTYQFVFHFKAITDQNGGINSSGRNTEFDLYYGTTARSQGDTSFDTKVFSAQFGRDNPTASTANCSSKFGVVLMGAFYQSASDDTIYLYFTGSGTDNGKRVVVYHQTASPAHLFITEYKGNLSTILT